MAKAKTPKPEGEAFIFKAFSTCALPPALMDHLY